MLEILRQWDPLIQAVVGLGTVLVAAAAFMEIRNSKAEARRREQLELAHRIYRPLREELDPITHAHSEGFPVGISWDRLSRDTYPASAMVPDEIQRLAEEVERGASRMGTLYSAVNKALDEFLDRQAHSLKVAAHHPGSMGIRFLPRFGEGSGMQLSVFEMWASGAHPDEWNGHAAARYGQPLTGIDVLVGNNFIGGLEDAKRLFRESAQFLDGLGEARQLRQQLSALKGMREELLTRISREVSALRTA